MSLDYLTRSKPQNCSFKCANDIILREIQSLIKQESYSMETENNHLKRNNEELTIKIQDLYNEFDIAGRTFKEKEEIYIDTVSSMQHLKKKSKRTQRKNSDLLKDKYEQRNTLNDLKSQLILSQDSLSMMKLQTHESDASFEIKNKEIELLENQNALLQKRIKNIENFNNDLQKERTIMTKSIKSGQKKLIENKPHTNIGLSVSIDLKQNSNSDLLKPEIKPFDNSSPTYIDIFDNKEKAFAFYDKPHKPHKSNKTDFEQIFVSVTENEGVSRKHNIIKETPSSPIYVDINSVRKQKFPSTEPIQQHIPESEINKTKFINVPVNQSFVREVDKEFVKLSHEHQLLNEKLDKFGSNYREPLIRVQDEENEILLKKTSEEIGKILTEQQHIINLLLKNSTTLDQLQEKQEADITNYSYLQNGNDFKKYNENQNYNTKQLKHLSCQTDGILGDGNQSKNEIQLSKMGNKTDILKLINDQNEKIRDLSDRFSLIQSNSQALASNGQTKIANPLFDISDKEVNVTMKSDNSFEDISIITDVVHNSSNKAVATFLRKPDDSKSLSSLLLSTSESKYTYNSELLLNPTGQFNDSFDNVDNLRIELPLETLLCPEKTLRRASSCAETGIRSNNAMRISSKIPRMIPSKSLDFSCNTVIEDVTKMYSNDLESSYETLYDPVSSARYERENTIPL